MPPRLDGIKVRLVDKPGQTQTHIRIAQFGIKHEDPRFFDTLVWNHVLGGGGLGSRFGKLALAEGGKLYGAKEIERLASLPTRSQALSMLLGVMPSWRWSSTRSTR